MRHFSINYIDGNVPLEVTREAVRKELDGPGAMLGYRAMTQKIRQKYDLKVPRALVHNLMFELDTKGLARRAPGAKKKKPKGDFVTPGPNWTYSMDGHDKMMEFQNSTFPIAIYGCLDTASRKLIWLKVWTTNSNPIFIGKWYLQSLLESSVLPNYIRIDKGTETTTMSTIHAYLRSQQGDLEEPADSILFGPSPSNQIERWWKELHDRLEKYFKVGLNWLKEECHYDPQDEIQRLMLAYVMVPLMQRELDEFCETIWNTQRIRAQRETLMADGIPNHIFEFPERYGMEKKGFKVTHEDLQKVAELSGVLDAPNDFLSAELGALFTSLLPQPEKCKCNEFVQTYLLLKQRYSDTNSN
ncbi:uncharacterized protein LOC114518673 [Dendronephthya gigantea]|uniref:uncharacterized protein LOC114518673 n=1 Tax=Dendronephthya gigantea TaxID=151771 RepID=UPI00106DB0F8|nr:uncharacterized protein LOC114518673 [Dendronephthya gigantea]